MLLYLAESAVRLATQGKRQLAGTDAAWVFATGVAGCDGKRFTCFFAADPCRAAALTLTRTLTLP